MTIANHVHADAGRQHPAHATVDPRTALYAGLILRVALGIVFIAHALLKPLVFTFPGTVAFFAAHGFPGWTAYPVFAAELVGGIALIAGMHTRWVSLALVPVLLGALTVHWSNGWSFTATDGGWEYVAFLIAALIAQAALGDGAYAIRSPKVWASGRRQR
ncbi:MAG: DoxX family protein [Gemmatimonadales bacterium]|nr:DoxX family protein [Gemmatimonadales bacterium]